MTTASTPTESASSDHPCSVEEGVAYHMLCVAEQGRM